MITLVMVPTAFIILPAALIALQKLDEKIYEYRFAKVPGVVSVTKYFNYEGARFADLQLKSGRRLSISEFDSNVFSRARYIGLDAIGDNPVVCSTSSDEIIGGPGDFNVVDYAMNRLHRKIYNVADLVDGYDELHQSLIKDMSPKKDRPTPVRQSTPGGRSRELLWCHLAPPRRSAFHT